MARRNGPNEGSVFQRKGDGLWVGVAHLGYEGGKRKRKSVYGRTRADAVAKLRRVQTDIADDKFIAVDNWTVETWMSHWLEEILPEKVKESTRDGYRWISKRYIFPQLGTIPLTKLTPHDVERLLSWMRTYKRRDKAQGLSVATQRQTRAILRSALERALKYGYVRTNVAGLVDAPRGASRHLDDVFMKEEAIALRQAAAGDPIEALFVLALTVGMRKGELLALKWNRVDLDKGTLTVAATLTRRTGHGLVLTPPKTARSARTFRLPETCVLALRHHLDQQAAMRRQAGSAWVEDDFVFTTPIGTPIDPRNLSREFDALCVRAKVARRRFHALRHTAATMMLAQSVPLVVVSTVLGHSSISVTADLYAKVVDSLIEDAVEAIDDLYRTA